ncbi:hypothetical protein LEP1GSC047_2081 [Leptospira inadai serovar Lyme str. 10]|uniref:Uncharacterized protein n=1 Tax=Leptospira inadai serovar Lyme str. 10 TaxID=1049790 RepID=V6HEI8_9LEPT|nr:hypothetical protein LEP1GSC047_2081 [Leptospira inadai serovar Lyme str. 10]
MFKESSKKYLSADRGKFLSRYRLNPIIFNKVKQNMKL